MHPYFKELGTTVLQRWKAANFSLEQFPTIACAALEERPPATEVELATLIQDFFLNDEQPFQTQSGFGQPELIAYDHPKFYIQLLFWLDGTTDIHQHEFSGAFHVMHGSSIHTQFRFVNAATITPHLRLGAIGVESIELLETGRTVPIISGPTCIHSLFHLDTPSVTVVVRTQHDPGTGPQFNYLPPHIAFDPAYMDALTTRRKQLLDVLEQMGNSDYPRLVREMIEDWDFERGFSLLQHTQRHLVESGDWDEILALFEEKHGPLGAMIAPVLEENNRRDIIKQMRGMIEDPEHRFFLALLLNVTEKPAFLQLVKQRFPEESAVETILRWAAELGEESDEDFSLLDAVFPLPHDADPGTMGESFLMALRFFLENSKKKSAALRGVPLEEWKTILSQSTLAVLLG